MRTTALKGNMLYSTSIYLLDFTHAVLHNSQLNITLIRFILGLCAPPLFTVKNKQF